MIKIDKVTKFSCNSCGENEDNLDFALGITNQTLGFALCKKCRIDLLQQICDVDRGSFSVQITQI